MRLRIAAASLVLVASMSAGTAATIDEVYAYGDSLNDCCNNPLAPFTNADDSWLVEFTSLIGATYSDDTQYNYATGGAQSGPYNAIAGNGIPVPNGLLSQIDLFEADAPAVDINDLAVFWVGTNDIWASSYDADTLFGQPGLDIVKPLGPDPTARALSNYILDNIRSGVEDLRDAGFGSALLLTPYDIGDSALVDSLSGPAQNTAYSEALRNKLLGLYTPGIDTYVLDVVSLIRELQAGSPENGFSELSTNPSCSVGEIVCEARPEAEQDSFIYYDFVHLTRATNDAVARAAADLITSGATVAPVPLPGGVWFGLSGLFALWVAAGRRKEKAA